MTAKAKKKNQQKTQNTENTENPNPHPFSYPLPFALMPVITSGHSILQNAVIIKSKYWFSLERL